MKQCFQSLIPQKGLRKLQKTVVDCHRWLGGREQEYEELRTPVWSQVSPPRLPLRDRPYVLRTAITRRLQDHPIIAHRIAHRITPRIAPRIVVRMALKIVLRSALKIDKSTGSFKKKCFETIGFMPVQPRIKIYP